MKKSQVAGYIICKRLNKKFDISVDAVPTGNGNFICGCGRWIHSDPYYHSGYWRGKKI
jgi:hypothetical protein